MSKRVLLVHHHLGVGDSIVCNGMIRYLSSEQSVFSEIFVVAKEQYAETIHRMYDDSDKIRLVAIPKDMDEILSVNHFMNQCGICDFIRCGFGMVDNLMRLGVVKTFDEGFYACAGIPFETRWTQFYYRRDIEKENAVLNKLNPQAQPYIFVHDDVSRGYTFEPRNQQGLRVIKNDISESIFDMGAVLEQATEIHCMESSFRVLIDHLPNVKCPLFFYPKVRAINGNVVSPSLKKSWNTVE